MFVAAASSISDFRSTQNSLALDNPIHHHDLGWARFDATPRLSDCPGLTRFPESEVNTASDGGKWLCGIKSLGEGCVIYSLGSNAEFDFEYEMVEATPCEVFTFDCTVSESEDRFPKDLEVRGKGRIHFFPW